MAVGWANHVLAQNAVAARFESELVGGGDTELGKARSA
jgi:hypothetical protein